MLRSLAKRKENPFSLWQREMSNLFDRFNHDLDLSELDTETPKLEVNERDNGYVIKAEVPGMSEKDINITLKDNTLVLEGERKSESTKEEKGRTFSEFSYGSFYRSIPFDSEINAENVKASYKDGILTIDLEKVPGKSTGGKKIPITYS